MTLSNDAIAENTHGGVLLGTLTPTLAGGTGYTGFALVAGAGSGNNGDFYVAGNQLRTTHNLNFEALGSPLSVRIKATAANGVSGEDTFTVALTNVNERPTNVTVSNLTVPENSAGGTVVGVVGAVDPDAGETFTYSLANNAGGRFAVSGNQLVVAAGANLDYEQQRNFYVAVRATDAGGLSAVRGFQINVTNVAEAPTGVTLTGQTVPENGPFGRYVGSLSATNPEGGATTFSLTNNAGGRFGVAGNTIVAVNANLLDYEAATSHQITVQATGAGGTATQTFTIQVTNENEAPTALTLSNASVALPATVVGTLTATDPDAGGSVQYILTNNAGGKFQLVGNELRTADQAQFGYDPAPTYQVTVLALDQGGLGITKTFTITVTGIPAGGPPANTAPTAINLSNASVNENSAAGAYVGTLIAIDDSPAPPALTLLDNAGGRFALNGVNLVVANGAPLDFETATSHSVTVRATDAGGLMFDKTFTISVNNVNEAPANLSLSNSSLTLPTTAGFVVGTLSSTDPDAGGSVSYFMAENGGGKFTVVGNQVRVTDSSLFTNDPKPSYLVHVYAQDQGGAMTDKWFTITITI